MSKNSEVIDKWLNGHGQVIEEEAQRATIDLALACALVEQESNGRNIFGCDHGNVGDRPPYCGQACTPERVQALIDSPHMNGIGLTQLTWYEFVNQAHAMGGAHIPRYQCRVGFGLLDKYIDLYPYMEALGAYNAGEGNRWEGINNGYAASVAAKHEAWKPYLTPTPNPHKERGVREIDLDDKGWAIDLETGDWIVASKGDYKTWGEKRWLGLTENPSNGGGNGNSTSCTWPVANDAPVDGNYQQRHPTRYTWRDDIEAWACWLVKNYPVHVNTYYDHPEGFWRTETSYDVWGIGGRNDYLPDDIGSVLWPIIFYDENEPNIDWMIYRREIWTRGRGFWVSWGTNDFEWHDDHIHVTYL